MAAALGARCHGRKRDRSLRSATLAFLNYLPSCPRRAVGSRGVWAEAQGARLRSNDLAPPATSANHVFAHQSKAFFAQVNPRMDAVARAEGIVEFLDKRSNTAVYRYCIGPAGHFPVSQVQRHPKKAHCPHEMKIRLAGQPEVSEEMKHSNMSPVGGRSCAERFAPSLGSQLPTEVSISKCDTVSPLFGGPSEFLEWPLPASCGSNFDRGHRGV